MELESFSPFVVLEAKDIHLQTPEIRLLDLMSKVEAFIRERQGTQFQPLFFKGACFCIAGGWVRDKVGF